MEKITEQTREHEFKRRTSELEDKNGKEFMETIRKKLDNDKECKIKDKKVIQLLRMKYRLVITSEYKKLHQDYLKCLAGFYFTFFSKKQISTIINNIEFKMSYVNSKKITLRQLKEEFEFVKEVGRRAKLPYKEGSSK